MRLRDADVVFVVDEDAGPHVARGVIDAGGRAVLVADMAGAGVKDRHWIPLASTWGTAIITRDLAMRRNPAETAALLASKCHTFILRAGHFRFDELYNLAKSSYRGMMRYATTYNAPFLATIATSGITVKKDSGRRGGPKQA